mmetsp:Transcript_14312/g.22085  ORF Transcript_14312/g.22085 Transcript_14312/m.22085 type:complete len:356 (+) Transcript_14312:80-1147(+)|eukprot:CAMPEP_0201731266 /NCGR_PEP_ID=MMETSP0593-20130828/25180_1 /ASSEMBLY_ACC=CAM_ASM_000672 /TAXON_ID=267983 /ORGANISM="Skeletonema japonicum, Strain CCMP2506" /LENGTH=355 /DNA_ID=CAMNT_0048224007 /DNA_START=42 /DNA_END=1109 /DNA_ORIENTATION=+
MTSIISISFDSYESGLDDAMVDNLDHAAATATSTTKFMMTAKFPISLEDAMNGNEYVNDVIGGRGKGVEKHAGNVNYRKLIAANLHLYKKCHDKDKQKISKGIVAAVRGMGGRFLRYNGKMYTDIKGKQAVAKTSQTLRDARNPNKNAFQNAMKDKSQKGKEEMGVAVTIDTTQEVDWGKELPQELYANYSYQVLKSLCAQQKAEMDSSNSNVSPGRMPSVTLHKRKGGDDERNTNDDTNESKELPKELYLRYTEQVLKPLHFQEGCHSHSFPTGTDVDAAPQNKRDSFISPRDAAISSSSMGVEISKVLENHDTRMSSGKICEELMKDDDVEMISTEQCLKFINCIDIGSIGGA